MVVNFFFFLLVLSTLTALVFILPPIWLARGSNLSDSYKYTLSVFVSLFFILIAGVLYAKLGAGQHVSEYYNQSNSQQRNNNRQVRPIYNHLQRAIIKNELQLPLDLQDLQMILNFATIHSKLGEGILQAQIKQLLEGILISMPQQITALNLLAVHAYKSAAYPQAVAYWQRILQQIPPDMHDKSAELALKTKIAEASLFESNLTKRK